MQNYLPSSDGYGYGKSTAWEYMIKSYAKDNDELCPCWDEKDPVFVVEGIDTKNVSFKIRCSKTHLTCRKTFPETEKEMADIFKRMYA